ncbi:MAG: M42 family peptidase [Saprospirales bacterium]|nr:MAG: M42 family peptidase [Saprospirales bacterium]
MAIDFELLKRTTEIPGAPGYEAKIRKFILDYIGDKVDEVKIDPMGSIIALRKGTENKKVMVAAHMDEIGFIVNHIDSDGFVRFQPLGGFDPKTLTSQRVMIHGREDVLGVMGSKPIHIMKPEERKKSPELQDYFIDTGISKEELEELIKPGDTITRVGDLIRIGQCFNGKSLDNRISVYVLMETLKNLEGESLPYDLYAVFSVQEEVGLRGARTAASRINPDFGFGLDTTIAYDLPGAQGHEMVTKLGKGTAIKIIDGTAIADYRMVEFLKEVAEKHNIKWQAEILPAGGTDTAAIQQYGRGGSITGAISIPTRYLHQTIEMVNEVDVDNSIELLTKAILQLDQFDWTHH